MKIFICNAVCIFFSLVIFPTIAQHVDLPPKPTKLVDAIKNIKSSIVRIEVSGKMDNSGSNSTVSGSGFFVSTLGYIITNNHVIDVLYKNIPNLKLTIKIPVPSKRGNISMSNIFSVYEAVVVSRDLENDLALLKVTPNPFTGAVPFKIGNELYGKPKLPQFSTRTLEDGEQVAVSGFPLNRSLLTTNVGYISTSDLPGYDYEADLRMNPGNSGGPVYLVETGQIVGVAVSITLVPLVYRIETGKGSIDIDPQQLIIMAIPNLTKKDTIKVSLNDVTLRYNAGLGRIIAFDKVLDFLKKNKIEIN